MSRGLCTGLLVGMMLGVAAAQQPAPPTPAQQRPVFRAGAHYVRVDAYPRGKDGKIIEGLTKDNFEIYEDGAPQAIENAEFITFSSWTPEAERRDPRTPEEGYALAADPTYRVFVIVIDREALDMVGWNVMHRPLEDFVERTLGPRDLFGLLSSRSEWNDLVFAQKTTTARHQLAKPEWWTAKDDYDDEEWALVSCGLESLIPRSRDDRKYSLLEGLVRLLGLIREERKSIVYVADGLDRSGPAPAGSAGRMPEIPRIGVTGGRLGPMPRDGVPGRATGDFCNSERMRLTSLDFGERFRDLLKSARQSNVSFYPISPKGLRAIEFTQEGGADLQRFRQGQRESDTLLALADQTDGLAIVNTNDLRGGLTRIANDLQAYYVLGYYTTNRKWDGAVRSIKVRLKPKSDTIRARRQYRAPTQAEIASLSAGSVAPAAIGPAALSPVDLALRALDRPPAGSAATPEPPTLLGEPTAYRLLPRVPPQRVDVLHFARTERMRVEWAASAVLDRRTVRVLDRTGKPLPLDVPVTGSEGAQAVGVELPLSAFAPGDYVLELQGVSGTIVARSLLAFRVR